VSEAVGVAAVVPWDLVVDIVASVALEDSEDIHSWSVDSDNLAWVVYSEGVA